MLEIQGLTNIQLPSSLTVAPAYGPIAQSNHPLAARFALFVLSEWGQAILYQYYFDLIPFP